MSSVIPQTEIDAMATEAANFFPNVVNIYRDIGNENTGGGSQAGKTLVGTNIPARLAPQGVRANLKDVAEREATHIIWILTLPAYTDIESLDEVVWNTRRFVVTQPLERDYEVTRRCLCFEVHI